MIVNERGPDDELEVEPGDENLGREVGRVLRVLAEFCESARDEITPEQVYANRRKAYDALNEMGPEHYSLAVSIDHAIMTWRRFHPEKVDAMREMAP